MVSYDVVSDICQTLFLGIHPDIIMGGTYYEPCVELVRGLMAEGWWPKALAMTTCAGDPRTADALRQHVRWLAGPTQWDKRLAGGEYSEEFLNAPVFHNVSTPSPRVFNEKWAARFGSEPNYQAAGSMVGPARYCSHHVIGCQLSQ